MIRISILFLIRTMDVKSIPFVRFIEERNININENINNVINKLANPHSKKDIVSLYINSLKDNKRIRINYYKGIYNIYNKRIDTLYQKNNCVNLGYFNGLLINEEGDILCIPSKAFFYSNMKHTINGNYDIYEAKDGTVVNLYYNDGWHLSTIRGILMDDTCLYGKSMKSVFNELLPFDKYEFDTNFTYTFRLSHPDWNIGIQEKSITFIQRVNNITFEIFNTTTFDIPVQEKIEPSAIHAYKPNFAGLLLRSKDDSSVDIYMESEYMYIKRKYIYSMVHQEINIKFLALHYYINCTDVYELNKLCEYFPEFKEHMNFFISEFDLLVNAIINRIKTGEVHSNSKFNTFIDFIYGDLSSRFIKNIKDPNTVYNIKDFIRNDDYIKIYRAIWDLK